jgi:hypothetical protein
LQPSDATAVTSAHYRVNPSLNFNQLHLSCIAGRQEFFVMRGYRNPGSGGYEAPAGRGFQAVELAMQEAIRLRELEAECRQRALSEPDKKWYWLAQAAKYQVQANQQLAFHAEETKTPDSPEIKLVQWSHVRDERRVMDPLPDGRRSPW